jgi:hypothetical protein
MPYLYCVEIIPTKCKCDFLNLVSHKLTVFFLKIVDKSSRPETQCSGSLHSSKYTQHQLHWTGQLEPRFSFGRTHLLLQIHLEVKLIKSRFCLGGAFMLSVVVALAKETKGMKLHPPSLNPPGCELNMLDRTFP